uniref:NUDIX hydrolase n=1 Tax=Pithovirus LCPAC202 TaxID=2506592 RepID=A0A481Z785_9VIRU|nr:MAG: NUDIX hydrolase [Pithovirus LCPAC202]
MIVASGVIPISINQKGEIVLLLGKEKFQPHLSDKEQVKGNRSGTWCGFGGKLEKGENVEECASREFAEESMNLLMSEEKMKDILTINHDSRLIARYTHDIYQEFAVYFKYDPDIPDQFRRVLNYFLKCKGVCPEGHFEKSEVKWFLLSDLIKGNIKESLRPSFKRTLSKSYPYLIDGMINSFGEHAVHSRHKNS